MFVEYFLDGNNIKGWQLWPEGTKTDLKDNPLPTSGMNELQDEHGNYKFRLENNQIIGNNTEPTIAQLSKKEYNMNYNIVKTIKILIQGIRDNSDTELYDLEELLNTIDE